MASNSNVYNIKDYLQRARNKKKAPTGTGTLYLVGSFSFARVFKKLMGFSNAVEWNPSQHRTIDAILADRKDGQAIEIINMLDSKVTYSVSGAAGEALKVGIMMSEGVENQNTLDDYKRAFLDDKRPVYRVPATPLLELDQLEAGGSKV